jgi:hypothetical protein
VQKGNRRNLVSLKLAWLAVIRRKRRSTLVVLLISIVIASSLSIGSTVEQLPLWVSGIAASSPNIILTYQNGSPIVGFLPENSSLPQNYIQNIENIPGIEGVTPLVVKDVATSLGSKGSLVIGINVNFWQLDLGLRSGHWPQPGTYEAVITEPNTVEVPPSTISIENRTFDVVGMAVSADLGLAYSVIISYTTAQKLFNMQGASSVFISQLSPTADFSTVSKQINDINPSFVTLNLNPAEAILKTLSIVVFGVSGVVVIIDASFTLAIIFMLALFGVNSRRWEYGLLIAYGGGRRSSLMIVLENLILFVVAIIPAILIASGILSLFVIYVNNLAGSNLYLPKVVLDSFGEIATRLTVYQYIADLISVVTGSWIASRLLLRKTGRELLSETHP